MAEYTITTDQRAVHAKTLAANVEDVVTFADRIDGEVTLIVHPGGSDPVYVTTDSAPATVGGPNTRVVFPGWAIVLTDQPSGVLSGLDGSTAKPPTQVRLISAAGATYSVEA